MEPGTCLDLATEGGRHSCDERSGVRIQLFQRKDLAMWFVDAAGKEKSEMQILADWYARTWQRHYDSSRGYGDWIR